MHDLWIARADQKTRGVCCLLDSRRRYRVIMIVNVLLLQWLGLVELLVRERFSAMEFVGETMGGGTRLGPFHSSVFGRAPGRSFLLCPRRRKPPDRHAKRDYLRGREWQMGTRYLHLRPQFTEEQENHPSEILLCKVPISQREYIALASALSGPTLLPCTNVTRYNGQVWKSILLSRLKWFAPRRVFHTLLGRS
jgi:hypothetical protein